MRLKKKSIKCNLLATLFFTGTCTDSCFTYRDGQERKQSISLVWLYTILIHNVSHTWRNHSNLIRIYSDVIKQALEIRCVCVCVCLLWLKFYSPLSEKQEHFYFAWVVGPYFTLEHYWQCVRTCVCARRCVYVHFMCTGYWGGGVGGAVGCKLLIIFVDVCQLMFLCLPLCRHFPSCKK